MKCPAPLLPFLVSLTLFISPPAFAHSPPANVSVDGITLLLHGTGVHTETFFRIRAYEASLYTSKPHQTAEEIISSDSPKQLVLEFLRDVDASDVQDVWRKGFAANNPNAESMRPESEAIAAILPDMDEGQKLVITSDAHGATVDLPGGIKRSVASPEFAAAVFRIWLGPNPSDPKIKSELLNIPPP